MERKAPGEPVTIADREAERMIAKQLGFLRPSARFVVEEACALDPALLDDLPRGEAWIVDPIDGTANYAAGRTPFAMMAAPVCEGETVAATILDPVSGNVFRADRGQGAWMNKKRIAPGAANTLELATGIVSGFQRPAEWETGTVRLTAQAKNIYPTQRCAGAEYPLVARGERDFALHWRSLAWDHAPGALIVEEAGGAGCMVGRGPYRPVEHGKAVLVARNPEIWDQASAAMGV